MFLIAKGETIQYEHGEIGDCSLHVACHSESGWMKEDLFKAYLQWLSPQMNGELFHLLIDCYSAHRTMDIKALAVQLGITLHYIPVGGTDQFQSPYLLIFRALKSTA
jgi:hypothetical protein